MEEHLEQAESGTKLILPQQAQLYLFVSLFFCFVFPVAPTPTPTPFPFPFPDPASPPDRSTMMGWHEELNDEIDR